MAGSALVVPVKGQAEIPHTNTAGLIKPPECMWIRGGFRRAMPEGQHRGFMEPSKVYVDPWLQRMVLRGNASWSRDRVSGTLQGACGSALQRTVLGDRVQFPGVALLSRH